MGKLCHQGRHLILQAPWRLSLGEAGSDYTPPHSRNPRAYTSTALLLAHRNDPLGAARGLDEHQVVPSFIPFCLSISFFFFFFSLPCSFSFISSLPLANSCFSRRFLSLPLFPPLALDPWCSNKGVGGGVADGGGGGAGPGLIHHRRAGAGRAEPKQGNCWRRGGIFHR